MSKRSASPGFVDNPFIKRNNKEWELSIPSSLRKSISPPPRSRQAPNTTSSVKQSDADVTAAEVEAGKAEVRDHLAYFTDHLTRALTPTDSAFPRLSIEDFVDLYTRNLHPHGRHFVIHQHDHPIAGTHYDLRLQCNATSSISFAIMYGLPGNPDSRRLNRNASETRVHNLWNHLIETASPATGSMLIWDTGEYSILPYREDQPDDSGGDPCDLEIPTSTGQSSQHMSGCENLHRAFQTGKIRLRLHGTRLSQDYTISLRLLRSSYQAKSQPKPPAFRRLRRAPSKPKVQQNTQSSDSDIPDARRPDRSPRENIRSLHRTATPPDQYIPTSATHSDDEMEAIRVANAYTGATNSINSIHQRTWFITLDRANSGFVAQKDQKAGRKIWVRQRLEDGTLAGFEPFVVRGRDHERSVVTGRLASEVLRDEGVEGYVGRAGWRPVTE